MKKFITFTLLLTLLGSCSHNLKEDKSSTEGYDETEVYLDDENYNDVCYYFEDELDEDVDNIKVDDESGMYFVHTTSGLTYTIMNLGGWRYVRVN